MRFFYLLFFVVVFFLGTTGCATKNSLEDTTFNIPSKLEQLDKEVKRFKEVSHIPIPPLVEHKIYNVKAKAKSIKLQDREKGKKFSKEINSLIKELRKNRRSQKNGIQVAQQVQREQIKSDTILKDVDKKTRKIVKNIESFPEEKRVSNKEKKPPKKSKKEKFYPKQGTTKITWADANAACKTISKQLPPYEWYKNNKSKVPAWTDISNGMSGIAVLIKDTKIKKFTQRRDMKRRHYCVTAKQAKNAKFLRKNKSKKLVSKTANKNKEVKQKISSIKPKIQVSKKASRPKKKNSYKRRGTATWVSANKSCKGNGGLPSLSWLQSQKDNVSLPVWTNQSNGVSGVMAQIQDQKIKTFTAKEGKQLAFYCRG